MVAVHETCRRYQCVVEERYPARPALVEALIYHSHSRRSNRIGVHYSIPGMYLESMAKKYFLYVFQWWSFYLAEVWDLVRGPQAVSSKTSSKISISPTRYHNNNSMISTGLDRVLESQIIFISLSNNFDRISGIYPHMLTIYFRIRKKSLLLCCNSFYWSW